MMAEATTDRTRELVPSGQLVTFLLEGVEFGLDIDRVQEITPRSDITPVPGSPTFVLGVINLRGMIIPVFDARLRFHLAPADPTPRTRIMVISLAGQPTGLQVDAVAEVVRLEDFQLRDTPPLVAGVRSEYLAGMVMAGNRLITLIDLDKLLDSSEFAERDALRETQALSQGMGFSVDGQIADEISEERPFVTFALGSESLGVTLDQVEEIVELPAVTRVPDAPDYVLGVICLREQVLPLLDLTKLLSVTGVDDRVREMVVLLSFGGSKLGIVVDGIQEIVRVREGDILPPPHTLSDRELGRLVGVVVRGSRMVTLIDVLAILHPEDQQKLLAMGTGLGVREEEEKDQATLPLVVFHLGGEAYGLRLEQVREVIRVGLITPVPRAPSFVDGVINLRGEVMPVVDLRTRFGLDRVEPTSLSRILITTIGGVNTGLVVDAVDEVRSVGLDTLGAPPRVTTVGANRYIEKVARTQTGMVFLLAIQELLTDAEEQQLQQLQGKKKG